MTFDELRTSNPGLGFAVYALDGSELVTLEIITPAGDVYTFRAATELEAIAAFVGPVVAPEEQPDVFE